MSPLWIKTILQVAASAVKRWWNRKKPTEAEADSDRQIIDEINRERGT